MGHGERRTEKVGEHLMEKGEGSKEMPDQGGKLEEHLEKSKRERE